MQIDSLKDASRKGLGRESTSSFYPRRDAERISVCVVCLHFSVTVCRQVCDAYMFLRVWSLTSLVKWYLLVEPEQPASSLETFVLPVSFPQCV